MPCCPARLDGASAAAGALPVSVRGAVRLEAPLAAGSCGPRRAVCMLLICLGWLLARADRRSFWLIDAAWGSARCSASVPGVLGLWLVGHAWRERRGDKELRSPSRFGRPCWARRRPHTVTLFARTLRRHLICDLAAGSAGRGAGSQVSPLRQRRRRLHGGGSVSTARLTGRVSAAAWAGPAPPGPLDPRGTAPHRHRKATSRRHRPTCTTRKRLRSPAVRAFWLLLWDAPVPAATCQAGKSLAARAAPADAPGRRRLLALPRLLRAGSGAADRGQTQRPDRSGWRRAAAPDAGASASVAATLRRRRRLRHAARRFSQQVMHGCGTCAGRG